MTFDPSKLIAVSYPSATVLAAAINGTNSANTLCEAGFSYPVAIAISAMMTAGVGNSEALHRMGFASSDAIALAAGLHHGGGALMARSRTRRPLSTPPNPPSVHILPALHAADLVIAALNSWDADRIEHLSSKLYQRVRQNPMALEAVLAELTRLEAENDEALRQLRLPPQDSTPIGELGPADRGQSRRQSHQSGCAMTAAVTRKANEARQPPAQRAARIRSAPSQTRRSRRGSRCRQGGKGRGTRGLQ